MGNYSEWWIVKDLNGWEILSLQSTGEDEKCQDLHSDVCHKYLCLVSSEDVNNTQYNNDALQQTSPYRVLHKLDTQLLVDASKVVSTSAINVSTSLFNTRSHFFCGSTSGWHLKGTNCVSVSYINALFVFSTGGSQLNLHGPLIVDNVLSCRSLETSCLTITLKLSLCSIKHHAMEV